MQSAHDDVKTSASRLQTCAWTGDCQIEGCAQKCVADLGAGTSAAVLEDMAFTETWFALCPRLANVVDIVIRATTPSTATPGTLVQIATEELEGELSQPTPDAEIATAAPEEAIPRSLLGVDIHDLEISPVRFPSSSQARSSTPSNIQPGRGFRLPGRSAGKG